MCLFHEHSSYLVDKIVNILNYLGHEYAPFLYEHSSYLIDKTTIGYVIISDVLW